jgi:hypothetical protein
MEADVSTSSDVSHSSQAETLFGGRPGDTVNEPTGVQQEAEEEFLEGRTIFISYNSSNFLCEVP